MNGRSRLLCEMIRSAMYLAPTSKTCTLFALTCLGIAITTTLSAQTSYGSIVGTVTDASTSSIPGAAVTLTNAGTAERRSSETDQNGSYQFVNLVPGIYAIDVEKAGLD